VRRDLPPSLQPLVRSAQRSDIHHRLLLLTHLRVMRARPALSCGIPRRCELLQPVASRRPR
jgi:hypothetical protein